MAKDVACTCGTQGDLGALGRMPMIKAEGVNTTTAVRRRPTVVGICMCMRCEREGTEDYI